VFILFGPSGISSLACRAKARQVARFPHLTATLTRLHFTDPLRPIHASSQLTIRCASPAFFRSRRRRRPPFPRCHRCHRTFDRSLTLALSCSTPFRFTIPATRPWRCAPTCAGVQAPRHTPGFKHPDIRRGSSTPTYAGVQAPAMAGRRERSTRRTPSFTVLQ